MNDLSESPRNVIEEARQIGRWMRRYAQNRSLPVVVFLVVFALLNLAILVPAYLGGIAYRGGNIAMFVVCLVVSIVAVGATIYVSVPRWGGKRLQQFGERLYEDEGRVTMAADSSRPRWLAAVIAAVFATCVAGSVILGLLGYLPDGKYMQPISAIYVVPFLVALNFLMRPITGYVPLLWPLLYALHALLIVAGAPIVFTGGWEALNMLVPIVGYGLLTGLIGHLYSRWALRSVRAIVGRQLDEAQLQNDGARL